MDTKYIRIARVDNIDDLHHKLQEAVHFIKEGKVVSFPTETVYGLGANALDANAVSAIYHAKGRPSDNPLIVHLHSFDQVEMYASNIPSYAFTLMKHFWPGPLTIILPAKEESTPANVRGNLPTIALRIPSHPIAQALLQITNLPIAAPSANISGRPSPTTADHVQNDFDGKIAAIIDGGPTNIGIESTVIDCSGKSPKLLRLGMITQEAIRQVIGEINIQMEEKNKVEEGINEELSPTSPGMKYKHYAPTAPMRLFHDATKGIEQIQIARDKGQKVACITFTDSIALYPGDVVISLGGKNEAEIIASNLFKAFRRCDELEVDLIFIEAYQGQGLGMAIMDRIVKAVNS